MAAAAGGEERRAGGAGRGAESSKPPLGLRVHTAGTGKRRRAARVWTDLRTPLRPLSAAPPSSLTGGRGAARDWRVLREAPPLWNVELPSLGTLCIQSPSRAPARRLPTLRAPEGSGSWGWRRREASRRRPDCTGSWASPPLLSRPSCMRGLRLLFLLQRPRSAPLHAPAAPDPHRGRRAGREPGRERSQAKAAIRCTLTWK